MTTSVKVTAHNFPTKVTVTSASKRNGTDPATGEPTEKIVHTNLLVTDIILQDGEEWNGVVTDTQSVSIEEIER